MITKLAQDIEKSVLEKLAGWEKRWIESRLAKGLKQPNVDEYLGALGKLNRKPHEYNARKWGGPSLDSAPFSSKEYYDNIISGAAGPSRIEGMKRWMGFSPTLSRKELLQKQLGGKLDHNRRADVRAEAMVKSPRARNIAEGLYYNDNSDLRLVMERASNRRAAEDIRYSDRNGALSTKVNGEVDALRNRTQSGIRKTLLSNGAITLQDALRGIDKQNSYYKGTKLPTPIANNSSAPISSEETVFISGRPWVSAGYAGENGEFIVGNRSKLMQNYPRLKFTKHLAKTNEKDRVALELGHSDALAGRNAQWGEDSLYEATAPWGAVTNPEYSKRFSVLDASGPQPSTAKQFKNTIVAPHGYPEEGVAKLRKVRDDSRKAYTAKEDALISSYRDKRDSLDQELNYISRMYKPKFRARSYGA